MKITRKKALARGLVTLLVLGAIGGGAAWTKVTVDAADRTAPTKGWKASEKGLPGKDDVGNAHDEGRTDTELSKELLPVPDHYRLGPDIGMFGNDVHLSGPKAEAWLAQSTEGLAASAVKEHRAFVSELDLQGMAMRSYVHDRDKDLIVEIRLAQMENKSAVKQRNAVRSQLADAFSALREGPEVEGYENAKCFLLPESELESELELDSELLANVSEIEEMFCTAYEDDTLVTFSATGSAPFAEEAAAKLLEKQLDRLTVGGGISV